MISPEDRTTVEDYFARWQAWLQDSSLPGGRWKKDWRKNEPVPEPISAFQAAALHHPNARIRRDCLGVLDHYANDASASAFAAALSDPVARVRTLALHGLSCERCRMDDLEVEDVVPALLSALASDPSAKVRHNTVFILTGLAARDSRVTPALARAAQEDDDSLVRDVAQAAVDGRLRDMGTRKALRKRARKSAAPHHVRRRSSTEPLATRRPMMADRARSIIRPERALLDGRYGQLPALWSLRDAADPRAQGGGKTQTAYELH